MAASDYVPTFFKKPLALAERQMSTHTSLENPRIWRMVRRHANSKIALPKYNMYRLRFTPCGHFKFTLHKYF